MLTLNPGQMPGSPPMSERSVRSGGRPSPSGPAAAAVQAHAFRRASLIRVAAGGLACAALVALGGFVLERLRLGAADAETSRRVGQEVQQEFAAASASLTRLARTLAASCGATLASPLDERATRGLFETLDAALASRNDSAFAVTLYGPTGVPVAWSGRPSEPEIPPDRIAGPPAEFAAPGPLGLRLVAVEPVHDRSSGTARRVGAVAAEWLLSARRGGTPVSRGTFTFEGALVPVSLRTLFGEAGVRNSAHAFVITAPSGEPLIEAEVAPEDIAAARQRWRRRVLDAVLVVLAAATLLLIGPLLDAKSSSRSARQYRRAVFALLGVTVVARGLLCFLAPPGQPGLLSIGSGGLGRALLGHLFGSPRDFLLTALVALAFVGLAADAVERWRIAIHQGRRSLRPLRSSILLLGPAQLAVGTLAVSLILVYQVALHVMAGGVDPDILGISLQRWDLARVATSLALLLWHAALFWAVVLLLRLGMGRWRFRRDDPLALSMLLGLWTAPVLAAFAVGSVWHWPVSWGPTFLVIAAAFALACLVPRGVARYRRASQASRLLLASTALIGPALVMYPSLVEVADQSKQRLVETQFAPQVMTQRDELLKRLMRAEDQIDNHTVPSPLDLVAAAAAPPSGGPPPTAAAYAIWSQTDLLTYRLASAVELYGPDGTMVSRFALNLPEYTRNPQKWQEEGCGWKLFEEINPFGSEERRLYHAGRNLCRTVDGRQETVGTIVVHVMLDYNALPFISSQSPYFELFRTTERTRQESPRARDIEFVVYGWSRIAIYMSGQTAWPLDEAVFSRIYASRAPFWAAIARAGQLYRVYFQNDRAGIYALGYPAIGPIDHLINMAEIAALGGGAYIVILIGVALITIFGVRRPASGRALLREVRASFYRRLFLAFVAASVVPVLTLALVARAYIAARLRSDVESAAVKTTNVARRVIDEYSAQQPGGPTAAPTFDDDIMVWISRVIDQDVNIFNGPRLEATSKRDLFASGLLPTRTPANVYRAVALERRPNFIGPEQAGEFRYLLAAAPVRAGERETILTVPLTTRQQEIEREIADVDRRIVLATLAFILVGAAIGYTMAERIADPVSRLTRATGRIARGDLDARIALTSSDELGRLVEAFNSMASDLLRQRTQLERTHRLEAWAEMARQVAHEIKNPLTPIQLSAEHLRRVHEDRGSPLSPVLDECVESILSQVRLLRQISAEFSSFASSPTPRPAPTSLRELVEEVIAPYRTGIGDRIRFSTEVPSSLPPVVVDRALIGRALANIVDNALHAMPGQGSLRIRAIVDPADPEWLRLEVADTSVGLDQESLRRLFEPYFSTKAIGTGLGLTIARRNAELNGGTIAVESEKGKGTTVTIRLPLPGRSGN
jgi:signal transduction histidine kinase